MPYMLQMLRALMQEHPDRAERLRVHVEALEASIERQPAFCLQNVRTLFEAAHATIAPQLGVTFGKNSSFSWIAGARSRSPRICDMRAGLIFPNRAPCAWLRTFYFGPSRPV